MPLPARHPEPTFRNCNIQHDNLGHDASLRHTLELARSQLRGSDVVRFDLADKVLLQRLDFDAQQGQAFGDVGPGAREDVCFGAGTGQVCGGWGIVVESDRDGDGGAVDVDEVPGDVGLARVGGNDDLLVTVGVVGAGVLNDMQDVVGVVDGGTHDSLDYGQGRSGAAAEMLVADANTAGFAEVGNALREADLVEAVVVCDELVEDQVVRVGCDHVRAVCEASFIHSGGNIVAEKTFCQLANARVDVHVLERRELPILSRQILFVGASGGSSAVLVAIDRDVRVEVSDECLEVSRLLASSLGEITIWVKAGGKETLEVRNTIRIVARQDKQVGFVEHGSCPRGFIVELPEERADTSLATWLVAVHAAMDVDPELLCAITCAVD